MTKKLTAVECAERLIADLERLPSDDPRRIKLHHARAMLEGLKAPRWLAKLPSSAKRG